MSAMAVAVLFGVTALVARQALRVERRARVSGRLVGDPRGFISARIRSRPTRGRRSRSARDLAMPELLEALARAVRGGSSVTQALLDVSVPDALAADVSAMRRHLAHGVAAPQVFAEWRANAASHPERSAAAALELAARGGGAMGRTLDRVADSIRERQAVHEETRALASQAQASAAVIGALPVAFAGLAAITEPAALFFLVATPFGAACLVIGLSLELAGALWMRRITGAQPW